MRKFTWDEVHTRLRQAVEKRLDLIRSRSRFVAAQNAKTASRSKGESRFFFRPQDLSQISKVLKQRLPSEVDALLLEADQICLHRFRLLGYEDLDYGREIDWHLDAVHCKKTPLKPWYRIRFLDFSDVGDHKVIWELNRHQHLVTLAKAWVLTENEKYASELVSQWYSWQRANPFPFGINWCSSLEVAFRSLSWLWVRALLANCRAASPEFYEDLLSELELNGRYIERYLSTYFSPNTHLIGEAFGLFVIGVACPEIKSANRWRTRGWQLLLQEADRQVRTDGMHFEQSLYYHVYALDFFLHARALAEAAGIEIPEGFDRTLEKMLHLLDTLSQAGPPQGFGDNDGGRLFSPGRNRNEHLTDPLALGAVLFPHLNLKTDAQLTEESVWLFGQKVISSLDGRVPHTDSHPTCFVQSGIYVMSSLDSAISQMVIDAGPLGTGRGGHGHADALNVTLSFAKRQWLIDPGTYCYISDGNRRDQFRSTSAHNTLTVDGLDQAVTQGPFRWSALPKVQTERWMIGKTFSLFSGNHTGYQRLPDPVLHRRFAFHLQGGFWLVLDLAKGRHQHAIETAWHFASDLKVERIGSAFVATPQSMGISDSPRIALLPAHNATWNCRIDCEEISPAYGRKEPAPVLRVRGLSQLPAHCAMMVLPLLRTMDSPGTLTEMCSNVQHVYGFEYVDKQLKHNMIFVEDDGIWTLGNWTSDCRFLYCARKDNILVHCIMCQGTFAEYDSSRLIRCDEKVDRLEWLNHSNANQIFTSSSQVIATSFPADSQVSSQITRA